MKSFVRQVGRLFGYDGTKSNALRKNPTSCLRSEDDELPPEKRKRLVARSRDIRRNFEIARWAINKHLDFTSDFTFRSVTGVAAFDDAVDAFMKDWMKAENCDVTGRFSLRRIMRMVEGLRTVDGDLLVVTLADGRLQLVEGDRIRDPEGIGSLEVDRSGFTQGVKLGRFGKHVAYAVHKRNGSGFTFERLLNAANAIHHGYFDRYDQIRGVSPMASSLNRLRDVYEGFDYALARSKQSQLFGIVINRKPEDDLADPPANTSEDDLAQPDEAPSFTFDPDGGPIQVDLETGEDAKFLESNTPSNEFRDFNTVMIGVALKALDLPYSFYDEAYTNFFGSKSAFQLYLKSAQPKRADNQELLNRLSRWRLMLAVLDGQLDPTRYGLTVDAMRWKWTPRGNPWLDAAREVRGDLMAIHAGFTDYETVVEERTGDNFYDVIDRVSEQRAYAAERGVALEAPQNLFAPDNAPAEAVPAGGK